MQWDGSPHAGFTTGEPWFPVNPNHDEINAEREVADPDSVFHHYRRLIERGTDPVVADGDFHMLLPEHPTLYVFTRSLGEESLLVLANFSGDGGSPGPAGPARLGRGRAGDRQLRAWSWCWCWR